MVSARAKRVLRNVWKHASPGLRAYGKQFAGVVDSEIGRRTAGTSYGALIPSASSFIPGSGLSLAGRGVFRASRMKKADGTIVKLPVNYVGRRIKKTGKIRIFKRLKYATSTPTYMAAVAAIRPRRARRSSAAAARAPRRRASVAAAAGPRRSARLRGNS